MSFTLDIVQFRPSKKNCLAWSQDGELAIAGEDHVVLFLPNYCESAQTHITKDKPWRQVRLKINEFSTEEWPQQRPKPLAGMSVGEELSTGVVVSLAWSPPAIGPHGRPILTILTSNHLLSFWASISNPYETSSWKRIAVLYHQGASLDCDTNVAPRIYAFEWSQGLQPLFRTKQKHAAYEARGWLAVVTNDNHRVSVLEVSRKPRYETSTNLLLFKSAGQLMAPQPWLKRSPTYSLFHEIIQAERGAEKIVFGPTIYHNHSFNFILSLYVGDCYHHACLVASRDYATHTFDWLQQLETTEQQSCSGPSLGRWINDEAGINHFCFSHDRILKTQRLRYDITEHPFRFHLDAAIPMTMTGKDLDQHPQYYDTEIVAQTTSNFESSVVVSSADCHIRHGVLNSRRVTLDSELDTTIALSARRLRQQFVQSQVAKDKDIDSWCHGLATFRNFTGLCLTLERYDIVQYRTYFESAGTITISDNDRTEGPIEFPWQKPPKADLDCAYNTIFDNLAPERLEACDLRTADLCCLYSAVVLSIVDNGVRSDGRLHQANTIVDYLIMHHGSASLTMEKECIQKLLKSKQDDVITRISIEYQDRRMVNIRDDACDIQALLYRCPIPTCAAFILPCTMHTNSCMRGHPIGTRCTITLSLTTSTSLMKICIQCGRLALCASADEFKGERLEAGDPMILDRETLPVVKPSLISTLIEIYKICPYCEGKYYTNT